MADSSSGEERETLYSLSHEDRVLFEKKCIAGGHRDRFTLSSDMGESVIHKTTNKHEVSSYERIFHSSDEDPRHDENVNF